MADPDPRIVSVVRERFLTQAHRHWRLLSCIVAICALFVALTTIAMLFYPGGSFPNPGTHGYLFFVNYFSDLGQTRTQSHASNYPSMFLFAAAVILIAGALAMFFRTFSAFLKTRATDPAALRLNRIAPRFGVASAICFIGLAMVPENVFAAGHFLFVQGAFISLLVAIVLQILALCKTSGLSPWLIIVSGAFVAILFGYILLMLFGPSSKTLIGDEINAVGQKLIVYLAITTIGAQALIVRAHLPRPVPILVRRERPERRETA